MAGRFKEYFQRLLNDGSTPLPKAIMAVLFSILLFNAMTMTMVFSYLPQLVKSFGTLEVNTGYYAGIISSALFLGRIVFSVVWGYIADVKGKKFTVIICSTLLVVSTLAFGFSYNLYWAIITRLLQGCSMGLLVACKTIVFDRCDDTNIALGMSIVLAAFSTGMIIGPSLGGFLVFPAELYPSVFSKDSILGEFDILLPNVLVVIGLIITTIIGIYVLPKDRRILPGEESYLINPNNINKRYVYIDETNTCENTNNETYSNLSIDETDAVKSKKPEESYIHHFQIVEQMVGLSSSSSSKNVDNNNKNFKEKMKNSKVSQVVRNKWCVICCIIYATYAVAGIGMDELFPLFTATSKQYEGMGFTPSDIGLALLICSIIVLVVQFTLMTKLTTKYGSKKMFIWCALIFALIAPLLPSISKIENKTWLWMSMLFFLIALHITMTGSFLAINILLNNSVDSSLLGCANGLGMSLSSIGRAIAPILFGSLYSWSLTNIKGVAGNEKALGFPFNQYFPFFGLSLVAILNAIMASCLPDSLNQQIQEENSDNEIAIPETSKTTSIYVSIFTPQSE